MIHFISHGSFGRSVLITEPNAKAAQQGVDAYLRQHPTAVFGPIIERCDYPKTCWGAAGADMKPGYFGPWKPSN